MYVHAVTVSLTLTKRLSKNERKKYNFYCIPE